MKDYLIVIGFFICIGLLGLGLWHITPSPEFKIIAEGCIKDIDYSNGGFHSPSRWLIKFDSGIVALVSLNLMDEYHFKIGDCGVLYRDIHFGIEKWETLNNLKGTKMINVNRKCFVVNITNPNAFYDDKKSLWINFIAKDMDEVIDYVHLNYKEYKFLRISLTAGDTTEIVGGTIELDENLHDKR
jgi:hypothetical protein